MDSWSIRFQRQSIRSGTGFFPADSRPFHLDSKMRDPVFYHHHGTGAEAGEISVKRYRNCAGELGGHVVGKSLRSLLDLRLNVLTVQSTIQHRQHS
jgi:hypothetical protein